MNELVISGEGLTLEQLVQGAHHKPLFSLASTAREKMLQSRRYIESRLQQGEVMYGVNTGFGAFSSVKISEAEIVSLQKNLIRSHCVGVGPAFSIPETRAMMILRANALARGHSAIRPEVVEQILSFLNQGIHPVVPSQGSVGASGDLAPLSHLALALMGEGKVWGEQGQVLPANQVLQQKGLRPLELKAKEGLSLINGCQVMTGIGLLSLHDAFELLMLADLAGALSLEALRGSRTAFDPLISQSRPHPQEIASHQRLRVLLSGESEIAKSHAQCDRVQDAYSLRCMPAVHGAVRNTLKQALEVLLIEANSSTDNPLVFAEAEKILSCGNFHGMPVAFQMDYCTIAITSLSSISEQRIAKLINPAMSGLPAFLAVNGGLHSGHMIVQVAAASLVSENKSLSHPASVDSIPTSADKEDHVSMGTIAARKFRQVLNNARRVVAMELLSATQGIELLRPLKSTAEIEQVVAFIRAEGVPFAKEDRVFAEDIALLEQMIEAKKLVNFCRALPRWSQEFVL